MAQKYPIVGIHIMNTILRSNRTHRLRKTAQFQALERKILTLQEEIEIMESRNSFLRESLAKPGMLHPSLEVPPNFDMPLYTGGVITGSDGDALVPALFTAYVQRKEESLPSSLSASGSSPQSNLDTSTRQATHDARMWLPTESPSSDWRDLSEHPPIHIVPDCLEHVDSVGPNLPRDTSWFVGRESTSITGLLFDLYDPVARLRRFASHTTFDMCYEDPGSATDFVLFFECPSMRDLGHIITSGQVPISFAETVSGAYGPNCIPVQESQSKLAGDCELQKLLASSLRLDLPGQITPVETWFRIQRHPRFKSVSWNGVHDLKHTLLANVKHNGYVDALLACQPH